MMEPASGDAICFQSSELDGEITSTTWKMAAGRDARLGTRMRIAGDTANRIGLRCVRART